MKAKFEVSHKNFLAVGHKRPETGLLVALNSIVPQRSRVLEVGAGQGPLKAAFNRTRPDVHWHAVDGALNIEAYTGDLVQYHDVCGPWPLEWSGGGGGGGGGGSGIGGCAAKRGSGGRRNGDSDGSGGGGGSASSGVGGSSGGGGGFDWIVSIEMAEHINPSCEGQFISLLSQARMGVVLSWSAAFIPGARAQQTQQHSGSIPSRCHCCG